LKTARSPRESAGKVLGIILSAALFLFLCSSGLTDYASAQQGVFLPNQESQSTQEKSQAVQEEPQVIGEEPEDIQEQDVQEEPQSVQEEPQAIGEEPEDIQEQDVQEEPQSVQEEPQDVGEEPPALQEIPATGREGDFSYKSLGRRDPFKSLLVLQEKKKDTSKLPPIQQVDLTSFKVVGLIMDEASGNRAMVKAPDGISYVIKKGDIIGKNEGEVLSISFDGITVREKFLDYLDNETTVTTVLKVSEY
jgi:Tfp pilus assembly protein PilP